MRKLRLYVLIMCSGFSLFVFSSTSAAGQSAYDESLVRAAVVFGILRFTTWPEQSETSQEVRLCAFGDSASARAIAGLKATPGIGEREVTYHEVSTVSALVDCHAVIIGDGVSVPQRLPNAILMICDGCESTTKALSSITLTRMDNRIQFEINLDRVQEQRLNLSSSLLELASLCRSSNPAIKGCRDE